MPCGFWPFFTNSARYTNLGLFWCNIRMTSEQGIEYNITILKNSKKLYILNLIFLSQSEYRYKFTNINLAPFFGPIWTLWRHKSYWISKFWQNDGRSKFSPQKIYMCPSLELSTVVWLQYIALKLLWRIWESDIKEGPPFHTFL